MLIVNKAVSLLQKVKDHWKIPSEGRYMPYKEIVSMSVGGIGVKFIVYCVGNMIISIGNSLIGNTIGIDPSAIYAIYIISIISGFPLTALRARMIDNAKSMKGKYRPYIISMGIPTVLLGIGFIWMPYENMSLIAKCITVLLFNIGFQFFYNFMTDAYDSLINVLSPNTIERTDVYAVKSVIENLSPSIANIFLPLVAKLITGDNTLYDLRVYRVLYPPMLLVGFAISVLVYVNTEERIVQPKNRTIQLSFTDAFRAVARNKYFWIISLAGWLGFLESSFNTIMGWMYNYQAACTAGQYSLIIAISGNASLWPNLFAPLLIRRYGKRKVLVISNLMSIGLIAAMLPVVRMQNVSVIWFMLIFTFINQLITSLGHFMNPSLNADIRDYQQYISGERIDGMFAAVGLIGSVITMVTSSVLPIIYERAGLNKSVAISLGYDGSNVYDVLFDEKYFVHICSVLIIASVIGAALNVIPFFFYDLTETKQRAMINVLKIRAAFEDYSNGFISKEKLFEASKIIEEAKKYKDINPIVISSDEVCNARKTKDKQALKAAKEKLKLQRETNENIEIARFVIDELNFYNTPCGIQKLDFSKQIVSAGINGFSDLRIDSYKSVEDKEIRRNMKLMEKDLKISAKTIRKHYPDGIKEFDKSLFNDLFDAEEKTGIAIKEAIAKKKNAAENGDKARVAEHADEIKALRNEKNSIGIKIKQAKREYSLYFRAVKPFVSAEKCIAQYENYMNYESILNA